MNPQVNFEADAAKVAFGTDGLVPALIGGIAIFSVGWGIANAIMVSLSSFRLT